MGARDAEAALLARCADAAREVVAVARDQREANVFHVAATIMSRTFPLEAASLLQASELYFATHPSDRMSSADVVRHGWVTSLPRLRDMLGRLLAD